MSGNSTTQSEPWTILRLLQWTTEHLKKHGSSSPRLDAEVLLAEARGCQRIDLYAAFNEEPSEDIKAKFRDFVRRRAAGEPVAYLVGKKEFYSLSFQVTPASLIPRGETEHVVIEALDRLKTRPASSPAQIVDVCTGSGCIAVSVAKHVPNCHVVAIDVSPEALEVARANIESHGVADRVQWLQGDLLEPVADRSVEFVLSNPPYVSEPEYAALDRSVRDHEPKLALVSGPTGTEILERLIDQSAQKLISGGWLIVELSPMIADAIQQRLNDHGCWTHVGMVRDLAGKKRVAVAQRT